MPPRKKAVVRKLTVDINESSDEAGSETRSQAPTKRAARGKAFTTTTAEKRAVSTARSRKKAVVEELSEEDVDPIEDDEMEDTVVVEPEKTKGTRKTAKAEPAKKEPTRKKGGRKLTNIENSEEEQTVSDSEEAKAAKRGGKKVSGKEDIPVASTLGGKKRTTKKERDTAAKKKAEREIAETQFEDMEVDPPSERNATEDEGFEIAPTPTQVHRAGIRGAIVEKPIPVTTMKGRRVVKPAVEEVQTEEEGEDDLAKPTRALPTVGRGRGNKTPVNGEGEVYKDLEKAYQALRVRYNNLQEAKETQAEQALKTFQKNMKEKDEERSRVIEMLQNDLKAQQKAQEDFSAETKVLKKKLTVKETETLKLQTKVQELTKNLQDQQSESKVMSAKLVQAQAQAQVQVQRNNAQVPGSAVKPGYRGPLGNPKANTGAVDDAWLARVKEELYADLCGLIIVNVRKENDSNVFECVQTGVNGLAVHFKLSVPNLHVKAKRTQESKDPADVEAVDEDEIIFIPLFDEARDKTVIDLLPEYLRDEISFQRDHMTKFYQKVNSLFMMAINTKQPEGESEDDDDDDDDNDASADEDDEEEE